MIKSERDGLEKCYRIVEEDGIWDVRNTIPVFKDEPIDRVSICSQSYLESKQQQELYPYREEWIMLEDAGAEFTHYMSEYDWNYTHGLIYPFLSEDFRALDLSIAPLWIVVSTKDGRFNFIPASKFGFYFITDVFYQANANADEAYDDDIKLIFEELVTGNLWCNEDISVL